MTDQQSPQPGTRARIVSWLTAGVVLFGFWSLGRFTSVLNEVFKGFGFLSHLTALSRFSVAYGSVLFPILGAIGATGIILAESVGRRQRFQALLFALLVAAWVLLIRLLLTPYMGPANPVIVHADQTKP